jgi:hypothetical protein
MFPLGGVWTGVSPKKGADYSKANKEDDDEKEWLACVERHGYTGLVWSLWIK